EKVEVVENPALGIVNRARREVDEVRVGRVDHHQVGELRHVGWIVECHRQISFGAASDTLTITWATAIGLMPSPWNATWWNWNGAGEVGLAVMISRAVPAVVPLNSVVQVTPLAEPWSCTPVAPPTRNGWSDGAMSVKLDTTWVIGATVDGSVRVTP